MKNFVVNRKVILEQAVDTANESGMGWIKRKHVTANAYLTGYFHARGLQPTEQELLKFRDNLEE